VCEGTNIPQPPKVEENLKKTFSYTKFEFPAAVTMTIALGVGWRLVRKKFWMFWSKILRPSSGQNNH
jgi:hypothetical protein